jgi:hypothetical protein
MKVLGVVQWATRDKVGTPIAGVQPLVEMQKQEWRNIDAAEEFPSQGQVFWHNALGAIEGALVIFRAEPNVGQKDEFRAVDAKVAYEVLDCRRFGNPEGVRQALSAGIKAPGYFGNMRVFAWCEPDVLVGPVDVAHTANDVTKLIGTNRHHLPLFTGVQVKAVMVDRAERLVRIDEAAPSSYVDWDDDPVVLRRAIESAVRVEKEAGRDTGQTKKKIEDAVRTLATRGLGVDAQLDRYRFERALTMLKDGEFIGIHAADIASAVREHPAVKSLLDDLASSVRTDVEKSARADMEQRLGKEREALKATKAAQDRAKSELDTCEAEVRKTRERLDELEHAAESTANAVEAAVNTRVSAALERPLDLLAEVSVLRPLLGVGVAAVAKSHVAEMASRINWSHSRGAAISDKASLRRMLTSAARTRGVDPSLMIQVHAAAVSGLMPVTFGSGALNALAAYGVGACGGRLAVLHVAPDLIQPDDLNEISGRGLLTAVSAAKDIDGMSLIILEGSNRAPLEASLLPRLNAIQAGLSSSFPSNRIWLSATLVLGATTVPVSAELFGHAVAIYSEVIASTAPDSSDPGDIPLSSDLLALGDVPVAIVDALVDAWPECSALRPALNRFGSALVRLYEDEQRIGGMLLDGMIIPYLSTVLSAEELAEVLARVGDSDQRLAAAVRRVRRYTS